MIYLLPRPSSNSVQDTGPRHLFLDEETTWEGKGTTTAQLMPSITRLLPLNSGAGTSAGKKKGKGESLGLPKSEERAGRGQRQKLKGGKLSGMGYCKDHPDFWTTLAFILPSAPAPEAHQQQIPFPSPLPSLLTVEINKMRHWLTLLTTQGDMRG